MGKKLTAETTNSGFNRLRTAAVIALVVVTIAVYFRATGFGFQRYHDDEWYVSMNDHVTCGLTGPSMLWAFQLNGYAANWHPLTWMSHMVDCSLYQLDPAGHHATSILLHIANILLLLFLLNRVTRRFWASAFIAALFALHPLHVESVAWIAERKDVLSTLFLLISFIAYTRYAEKPSAATYIQVAVAYTLGLLAKPMLVTFPLLLILFDWWPLGRLKSAGWKRIILEKLPLLALAIGSSVATVIAQNAGGAVKSIEAYSIGTRISTAVIAYSAYILKTIWPAKLAALYPHPVAGWPTAEVAISAVFLIAVTILTIKNAKTRPYLLFGWAWYVISLVPVIGLIQVGEQSYADRYTYIPLIGIFLIVAFAVPELVSRFKSYNDTNIVTAAALAVLLACSIKSFVQVGVWKDSVTLFQHAIDVVPNNYLAEHELGAGLAKWDGEYSKALPHLRRCLAIKPHWPEARFTYSVVLYWDGEREAAAKELKTAEADGFNTRQPGLSEIIKGIRGTTR